ncbi:phage protein NinX family protein [Klebsiella quasipneumoniae]|uniref:phage protein NinX family protein n=1 Tax=Klebsiella quasipneumoniae TaxID=1463165 RepID=UPI00161DB9FC|nr:phage protein NinX family protein [Klebsiella quasipneumoniae]QNC78725.1 DUF2591 domain-containing protein [Klebsiella quasipneumoniae]
MDYSKMSDFEINAMVHFGNQPQFKIENGYVSFLNDNGLKTGFGKYYYSYNFPDYCNNPVDAWPIIDENNITIINDNPSLRFAVSEVAAYFNGSNHIWSAHENGLRAAMITFLKMQESQNAKIPSERDS